MLRGPFERAVHDLHGVALNDRPTPRPSRRPARSASKRSSANGSSRSGWRAGGDALGHALAGHRRRLEAPGAPAGVDVVVLDRREAHDRAEVGRHVGHARPLAQHLHLAEEREQLEHVRHQAFLEVERGARGVERVGIGRAAHHQLAARALRDVDVQRARDDDRVEERLERLATRRPAAAWCGSAGAGPPCRRAACWSRRPPAAPCRRATVPRVVSTPRTRPASIRMPVTSVCWCISTPRFAAARA